MNLYKETSKYKVHIFKDRVEWLRKRIKGIGGSDASTLVGKNPYKDNLTLYKEKKGIYEVNFMGNKSTEYGTEAEPFLRELFKLKNEDIEVQYQDNCILQSKECEWRLYSPDALLKRGDERGILEIKTSLIQNSKMLNEWKDQVPTHYFIQTLHGLLVTDFDFVIFYAELRLAWCDEAKLIQIEFSKKEVKDSLEWLKTNEEKAYQYYLNDIEPPQLIEI